MSLEYDIPEAVAHLRDADKRLAKVIDRAGAFQMRIDPLESPFEALLRAIIFQQLAGAAATKIWQRVVALLPKARTKKPHALLETPEDDLRGAGLSANKLKSLQDLAGKSLDGTVPPVVKLRKMSDEEIIERLTSVRGIGEWTVHMLLLSRLGRPDVLPTGDYGIRKGFMLVYKTPDLPTPTEMIKKAQRWRPYRSVASWYLWKAIDLADGKVAPPPADAKAKKSNSQPKAKRKAATKKNPGRKPKRAK